MVEYYKSISIKVDVTTLWFCKGIFELILKLIDHIQCKHYYLRIANVMVQIIAYYTLVRHCIFVVTRFFRIKHCKCTYKCKHFCPLNCDHRK